MGPDNWSGVDFIIDDLEEVVDGVRVDLAFQILKVTEFVPDWLGTIVLVVRPAGSILFGEVDDWGLERGGVWVGGGLGGRVLHGSFLNGDGSVRRAGRGWFGGGGHLVTLGVGFLGRVIFRGRRVLIPGPFADPFLHGKHWTTGGE